MPHRAPTRRRPLRALLALLAALGCAAALSACGGDGGGDSAAAPGATARTVPPPGDPALPAEPGAEAVVRRWAATLRRGDVAGAAALFALPAIVSNGSRPVTLATRAQLRMFNRALPCGAVVLDSRPGAHGFLVVTFRLTERRGPGTCGSGAGGTARTALRVTDGRIDYWLRLSDPTPAPRDPAPAPAPDAPAPERPAPAGPGESTV